MEDIKDLEGLEIFLGYKCNINCSFCYQKDLRLEYKDNISKEEVLDLLNDGFLSGKRFVIFSGGEPTLDKNLPFYIDYSKKLGFEHIRVHTNGFMFKNYEYLENLYHKGLTGITISIHGYKGVHDTITKVNGSFNTVFKALINFEKLKKIDNNFVFDINTVVCKINYKYLVILTKFLCNFSFTRCQMVISYSLGLFNSKEKENIIPKYNFVVPYIEKSLHISNSNNKKIVIENIPFCMIKSEYWDNILENIKISKESYTILDTQGSNLDNKGMHKSVKCNKCSLFRVCRGIQDDYNDLYGNDFLNPIKGKEY